MKNDMDIQLNEKVAEMVKKQAKTQGLTIDEVVNTILEWYFEDCEREL